MSHPGNRIGLIFAVLGAVGFSFKAILIKLAYPYGVDAVTLLALRMGLSLPFFLALGWADQRRRQPVPLAGRDWGLMLGLGFSGYYLASYLDFLGLQYISAALERLILFAYPTLVVLFSAFFLGKPVTRRAAGAIGLCYAGIALAVAHDLDLGGDAHEVWLGGALVFGSAVSYALYLMGNGQAVGRLGAARVREMKGPPCPRPWSRCSATPSASVAEYTAYEAPGDGSASALLLLLFPSTFFNICSKADDRTALIWDIGQSVKVSSVKEYPKVRSIS